MKTFWLICFGVITLASTFVSPPPAMAQQDKCEGMGYIRPNDGGLGTIYLIPEPLGGRFKRLGYLPAGTLVKLEAPFTPSSARFQSRHCGFSYGSVVRGHIDRNQVRSLDNDLDRLGIDPTQMQDLIAPAHPDAQRPLKIFSDRDLRKVTFSAARNQNGLVFAIVSDENADQGVIEVRFVRSGVALKPANLERGFIDAEQDRDISFNGTFRRHAFKQGPPYNTVASTQDLGWLERFKKFVNSRVADGNATVSFTTNLVEKQLLTLAGCKRKGEISLELKANGGFSSGILGASAEGSTSLLLSIDEDEVLQFATLGNDQTTQMSISGLTKCAGRQPFFLQEADIAVRTDPHTADGIRFSIVRSEFFNMLLDEPMLKDKLKPERLDTRSRISNPRGNVHPIFVVHRIPLYQEQHYWAYFDALERFLTNSVFSTVDVPKDMQLSVVFLTMEALSDWR